MKSRSFDSFKVRDRCGVSWADGFQNGAWAGVRRGWNKARVLNTTDVHLLAACLPAWCSYPWTADARRWILLPSFSCAYACTRACIYVRVDASRETRVCLCIRMRVCVRACVWRGRRVVKQVAPKPRPWAVAVKYCGCFKNRSNPSRRYFPSSWRTSRGASYPISREELVGKIQLFRKRPSYEKKNVFPLII